MILNHDGLSSVRGVIARDRSVLSLVRKFSRPPRRVNARAGPVTRAASCITKPRGQRQGCKPGLRFAARDRFFGFRCPPGPTKLRPPPPLPFQQLRCPKHVGHKPYRKPFPRGALPHSS
jgi:hypothetical protein